MFIQTEETPNPNTLKFIPEKPVLGDVIPVNTTNFIKGDACLNSPLAKVFLDFDGIEGVYLGKDFISITKSTDYDWLLLKPIIFGTIMDHYINQQPIYLATGVEDTITIDDPISRQIKEIIETKVRPSVAADGGDIKFHSFTDGVVYLAMEGACSGCPSSTVTLKSGIENMLKYYIPEVKEVRQVEV